MESFISFIFLVIFLLAAVECACSILEKGLKYTVGNVFFWMTFGFLCSLLATGTILILCKKHGVALQATTFEIIEYVAEFAAVLGAFFVLREDINDRAKS